MADVAVLARKFNGLIESRFGQINGAVTYDTNVDFDAGDTKMYNTKYNEPKYINVTSSANFADNLVLNLKANADGGGIEQACREVFIDCRSITTAQWNGKKLTLTGTAISNGDTGTTYVISYDKGNDVYLFKAVWSGATWTIMPISAANIEPFYATITNGIVKGTTKTITKALHGFNHVTAVCVFDDVDGQIRRFIDCQVKVLANQDVTLDVAETVTAASVSINGRMSALNTAV